MMLSVIGSASKFDDQSLESELYGRRTNKSKVRVSIRIGFRCWSVRRERSFSVRFLSTCVELATSSALELRPPPVLKLKVENLIFSF